MDYSYKYFVVGYSYEYYWYCYNQLNKHSYSAFEKYIEFPPFLNRLYGYDSKYLRKFSISKKIWIYLYINKLKQIVKKKNVDKRDNICFVLLAGGLNIELLRYGLIHEIRKTFPNSKLSYFISDVSDTTRSYISTMKAQSDLVITFDPIDAKKYNLLYHTIPYSEINYEINYEQKPVIYDIAFVGIAKERLKYLLALSQYLTSCDVKCRFVIVNVPKNQQIMCEGIEYKDWVGYKENLDILLSSNCILDFTKNVNCEGNTLRIGESVILNKKILSNNIHLVKNGIYEDKYMRVFTNYEDIDIDFLKTQIPVDYKIKGKLYPEDLLECINANLID